MKNNPFSSTVALWWFTGISLIVEAVFDMITLIMRRKNDGEPKRKTGMEQAERF